MLCEEEINYPKEQHIEGPILVVELGYGGAGSGDSYLDNTPLDLFIIVTQTNKLTKKHL